MPKIRNIDINDELNGNNGSWTNTDDVKRIRIIEILNEIVYLHELPLLKFEPDGTVTRNNVQLNLDCDEYYFLDYLHHQIQVTKNYVIHSSLNGNNGEWTNSDDVEVNVKGTIDSAIDKINKATKSKYKATNENQKGKTKRVNDVDFTIGKITSYKLNTQNEIFNRLAIRLKKRAKDIPSDPNDSPEEQCSDDSDKDDQSLSDKSLDSLGSGFTKDSGGNRKRKPKGYCVKSPLGDLAMCPDGICRYDLYLDKFVCWNGKILNYYEEGEIVENVINPKLGYLEVMVNKGCAHVAKGLYNKTALYDNKIGNEYYRNAEYVYYADMFSYFTDQFKSCVAQEHTVRALLANGGKDTYREPSVVEATIRWFITTRKISFVNTTGSQDFARAVEGNIIPNEESWFRLNCTNDDDILFHIPEPIPDCRCFMEIDWEWRTDYTVTKMIGCTFPDHTDPDLVPEFNTMNIDPENYKHWNRHSYFNIHGDREFQVFSNTPENMLLACKRFAAKRNEEELLYDLNQLSIVQRMRHKVKKQIYKEFHSVDKGLADTLKLPSLLTNEVIKENVAHNLMNFDADYGNWMADQALNIVSQCNRDVITRWIDKYKNTKHWLYYKGFELFLTTFESTLSRDFNANIDHVKKKLRLAYVKGCIYNDDKHNMVRRLNAKVKRELAKPGKVPRLFVSYDAGCMYANELPEYIKVCLNGSFFVSHQGITMHQYVMSKPRTGDLDNLFNMLMDSLNRSDYICHVIYSDDSVIGGKINSVPFSFNADISGSDSSIRELVFYTLGLSLSQFHKYRAVKLVEQCTMPVRCQNPANDAEFFELKFNILLGSGNALTTDCNHIWSMLWGRSVLFKLHHHYEDCLDRTSIGAHIVNACKSCGVKIGLNDNFVNDSYIHEKVQFLKHSPMQTIDGKWISCMNLGPILRGLGQVDDCINNIKLGVTTDVFNRMSYSERLDRYWSGVVKGHVHEPKNIILQSLRERFSHVGSTLVSEPQGVLATCIDQSNECMEFDEFTGSFFDNSNEEISSESLKNRYGVDDYELEHLASCINRIALGYTAYSMCITKIMNIDYEL